jgi:hypothetical protein
MGHYDANGAFVPPVDLIQARNMPEEEIDIYLRLDGYFSILQRQKNKNKKGTK